VSYTGKIIILAFPDTFVTMSTEWICKVLPWVGLGTKEYIKAGHAALVLIENSTGNAHYFDFGRYVTPVGHGRVRGANTDVEIRLPIKARFKENGTLGNLDEFLTWLHANPKKTHGSGRLLASVCDAIDFEKASNFIYELQERGSIPYGAFCKDGSNCARFVTDTLISATDEKRIIKALKFNKKFTPSTVGNVEKGTLKNEIFEVSEGKINTFTSSAFKENLTNYFDKKNAASNIVQIIKKALPNHLQKLSGTGGSAYFEITETPLPEHHVNIRRYNDLGELDFDGVYVSEAFDPTQPYEFTYDSHCAFCHLIQNNKKLKLLCVGPLAEFNLTQKQRSA